MESTLTPPSSTAETANSLGAFVVRKRPLKSLQGIGFISLLWVRDALNAGLFSNTRSYTVASVIAGAGDCDGRYCFLYLASMVERCGKAMSIATVKRAVRDLIRAGLVRKLNRQQTRAFFAEELAVGQRWADRLPCVLELLVPACAYPEQTLAEINEVRAELGEEPLDDATRPYPLVGTTAQDAHNGGSDCATNLSPTDSCPSENPGSVRGTSTTGGVERDESGQTARECHPLLAHISDSCLRSPVTDRLALDYALRSLWEQGMTEQELTALVGDAHRLRNPFPVLMTRMRGVTEARAFLRGQLGHGLTGAPPRLGGFTPAQFPPDEGDPFGASPRFEVDALGQATGTCPDHSSVRNLPGGACRLCGQLCRSHPGELMHPPVQEPSGPTELSALPEHSAQQESASRSAHAGSHAPQKGLDPELLERMSASLVATCIPFPPPVAPRDPWLPPGAAPSPRCRTTIDHLREHLVRTR
ncbi:hypothetical protein [Nocardiopsis quinghaiensis]|uniref:hypothetical protein n=1 Tax=Nocardiopsis quinghaiensis TaxID=464995 RepID=UPI00123C4214|nr:hypothetical protein [Nocardiopsis quinghaiensis]